MKETEREREVCVCVGGGEGTGYGFKRVIFIGFSAHLIPFVSYLSHAVLY